MQVQFGIDSWLLVLSMFFSPWCREGTFLLGHFVVCFSVEMGRSKVKWEGPASPVSQVPSTQNNQYAEVAYFAMHVLNHFSN